MPPMMRRTVLTALPVSAALAGTALGSGYTVRPGDAASFARYIEGVKAAAQANGISPAVLEAAFANVRLNPRVIDLDRNQPEVQFTWEHYRTSVVSDARVAGGRWPEAAEAAIAELARAAQGADQADTALDDIGAIMSAWGTEGSWQA